MASHDDAVGRAQDDASSANVCEECIGRKRRRKMSGGSGIRMIEFFSGIGGMKLGVERALNDLRGTKVEGYRPPPCKSCGHQPQPHHQGEEESPLRLHVSACAAYEISIYANQTYAHNFNDEPSPTTKLVEQLKPPDLDGRADLWTLSPPCQPFTLTTNAKRNDAQDRRTDGFKGIMRLLEAMTDRPRYILLENVRGFVGSDMLGAWYDCLDRCEYSFREYLLSPMQVGIPNNRTRYYIICERSDRFRPSDGSHCPRGDIVTDVPSRHGNFGEENATVEIQPISRFIDDDLDKQKVERYILPEDLLSKGWARNLPVVSRHDRISHCFTAAYGRIVHKATGSLLLMDLDRPPVAEAPIDRSDMVQYSGRLRRFTPDELLALFGFRDSDHRHYNFPPSISLEHRYKLVGNSVSVFVVARVAAELLSSSLE